MVTHVSRHSPDELERLAGEIYATRVKPGLHPEDEGKFVAIDVDTGEFEIDEDDYTAVMSLRKRIPEADMWLSCVGFPTTYRMRNTR